MLALEKVCYSRNDVPVVEDASLSVGEGGALRLEGPNGSGKSTLIGLMSGLLQPDSGQVLWRGTPISSADSGYRGSFAHVGHKYGLKADLTPEENLDVHVGLSGAEAAMEPREALSRLGVAAAAGFTCRRLSAGQLRRVSLARLLVCDVALWLLDEPFANLDDDGRGLMSDMLRDHLRGGMAVLTAHQPLHIDGVSFETHLL